MSEKEQKYERINNSDFDLSIVSEMKKEDFIKQYSAPKGQEATWPIDAEDCWNQIKALSITPAKKK